MTPILLAFSIAVSGITYQVYKIYEYEEDNQWVIILIITINIKKK